MRIWSPVIARRDRQRADARHRQVAALCRERRGSRRRSSRNRRRRRCSNAEQRARRATTSPNRALVPPISPTSQVVRSPAPAASLPVISRRRAARGQRLDKALAPGIGIIAAQASSSSRSTAPCARRPACRAPAGSPRPPLRRSYGLTMIASPSSCAAPAKHDRIGMPGIVRILRGEIFLGDQVHAVAQRRHQRRSAPRGRTRSGCDG